MYSRFARLHRKLIGAVQRKKLERDLAEDELFGIAAALALLRLMTSMLLGVSATDPALIGGVAFLLARVAFGACYLPAKRALRLDPIIALRYQ